MSEPLIGQSANGDMTETPKPPFVLVQVNAQGGLDVQSNVRPEMKLLVIGLLEAGKQILLTQKQTVMQPPPGMSGLLNRIRKS